jgi:hypothetical protein
MRADDGAKNFGKHSGGKLKQSLQIYKSHGQRQAINSITSRCDRGELDRTKTFNL